MASILDRIYGKVGKAIDVVGRAAGNILPEFGLSEMLEAKGAYAMEPQQRVEQVAQDPRFQSYSSVKQPYYPTLSQIPDQPSYTPSYGTSGNANITNYQDLVSRFPGYAGWDPQQALSDFQATGGAGKGGSSGGGSGDVLGANDVINNMVRRGGYDPDTARQVFSADPERFTREFGLTDEELARRAEAERLAQEEAARRARQSRLDAINARLALMRDVAARNIETAKGVKEEVIGNIGTTYQNLLQSAQNKMGTALENLG